MFGASSGIDLTFDFGSIDIFETLGRIFVLAIIIIVLFGAGAILLGYISYRTDRMIFPRTVLFVIDLLYSPMRRIIKFFHGNYYIVDHIAVKIRNDVNFHEYERTDPERRVLIVPQCMRHLKCPAKMSSSHGFDCKMCGLCGIGRIAKVAKAVGTPLYISPGGTFSKRILRQSRPKAVIGVACSQDLYEGTLAAKMGNIPSQGVPLSKTGCVETFTNEVDLARILLVGIPEDEAQRILDSVDLEDYEERAQEEQRKARTLEDLEKLKDSPGFFHRKQSKEGAVKASTKASTKTSTKTSVRSAPASVDSGDGEDNDETEQVGQQENDA